MKKGGIMRRRVFEYFVVAVALIAAVIVDAATFPAWVWTLLGAVVAVIIGALLLTACYWAENTRRES